MTTPGSPDSDDRYWQEMGRSLAVPTDREVATKVSVLRHHLRAVLPRIAPGPIYDVGCGRGDNLLAFGRLGFSPARGCDLGAPQVECARRAGLDVEVGDGLAKTRDVRDAALVTAFDVLEHLEPRRGDELISLIFASLRPGGWMLAQFPNCASPFGGAIQWADPTHVRPLTPDLLEVRARAVGFQEVRALEVGPVPYSLSGVLRTTAWAAMRGALWAWDAVETGRTARRPYTRVCIVAARK